MTQLFSPRASHRILAVFVAVPVVVVTAAFAAYFWSRSDAAWNVGKPAPQPIPFQHSLHSGDLGIACRYCHAAAERVASAGMPSAQTCLTCHNEIWQGAGVLEPVRTAAALGQPIRWTSLNRLPDHSYFNHAAHVTKGVACETCHGRVDRMAETVKAETLSMGWCLDCHRDPEPRLRPAESVWAMGWEPSPGTASSPKPHDHADVQLLTSCSTCHR